MTLSIVAKCPNTGQFGVAAFTAMPAVGKLLAHAHPHVGAVATQARVNPYLGIDGLKWLEQHLSATDVGERLVRADPRIQSRQLGIVDAAGRTFAFTGEECLAWAGHREGAGVSLQGNRIAGPQVLERALAAFERARDKPLAERLLEALEAGDAHGGDRKGEQSATLYVVDTEEYPLWDIRIDLHEAPLAELRRLYQHFLDSLLPDILRMPTRRNPAGTVEEHEV